MGEEAKLVIGKAYCYDIEQFKKSMGEKVDHVIVNTAAMGKPITFTFAFEATRRIEAVRAAIAEAMATGMNVKKIENVVSSTQKRGSTYLFIVNGQRVSKEVLMPMCYLVGEEELPSE